MKSRISAKVFFTASILFLFQIKSGADINISKISDEKTSEKNLRNIVGFLSSSECGGRKAGSEGEKNAMRFISNYFSGLGPDITVSGSDTDFKIIRQSGDTIVSGNIVGIIPGCDKELSSRYILIGAGIDGFGQSSLMYDGTPVTQTYYGANANSSGVAVMSELARKISKNPYFSKRSIIFAVFGASLLESAGSWYFLEKYFKDADKIDAMINIDRIGGNSEDFIAYTSANRDMNKFLAQTSGMPVPAVPKIVEQEPFASDHRIFYAKQIPSVLFSTGNFPEYGTIKDVPGILNYEDMVREVDYIYSFVDLLSNTKNAPSFRQKVPDDSEIYDWSVCDLPPVFMNTADPSYFLKNWVYTYLKYPEEAVERGIEGKVKIRFIIDKNGKMTDPKVIKGVADVLDAEALRVVQASPDWKPAKIGNKAVNCAMQIVVEFRLKQK